MRATRHDATSSQTRRMNANTSTHGYIRHKKGFTLIELMVTVAVVAILAAIAYPSYTQYVIRGKRAAAKSAMMDIANRQQQFLMSNRAYADKAALEAAGYALDADVGKNYGWDVVANNALTPPRFTITFTPSGAQSSDGPLTLNSRGEKTPPDKWEK